MFLLYSSAITSKEIFAAMGLQSLSMVYMKFCNIWNKQWIKHKHSQMCPFESHFFYKILETSNVCVCILTVLILLFLCLAFMFLMSVTMCVYRVCDKRTARGGQIKKQTERRQTQHTNVNNNYTFICQLKWCAFKLNTFDNQLHTVYCCCTLMYCMLGKNKQTKNLNYEITE